MTTPEQIKEKTFEKVAFGGYNVAEVNAFMLKIAADYQELRIRSETLTDKMKVLVKTIEKYRDDEDTIKDTLIKSQKMSAEMIEEAQKRSDELMATARLIAQNKIAEFKDEFRREELKLNAARRLTEDFVRRVCEACGEFGANLVENMRSLDPELTLPVLAEGELEEADDTQNDVPDDGLVITPDMENRSVYNEDDETAQPEATQSEDAEGIEDTNEKKKEEPSLQFGKNYSL